MNIFYNPRKYQRIFLYLLGILRISHEKRIDSDMTEPTSSINGQIHQFWLFLIILVVKFSVSIKFWLEDSLEFRFGLFNCCKICNNWSIGFDCWFSWLSLELFSALILWYVMKLWSEFFNFLDQFLTIGSNTVKNRTQERF